MDCSVSNCSTNLPNALFTIFISAVLLYLIYLSYHIKYTFVNTRNPAAGPRGVRKRYLLPGASLRGLGITPQMAIGFLGNKKPPLHMQCGQTGGDTHLRVLVLQISDSYPLSNSVLLIKLSYYVTTNSILRVESF